MFNALSIGKRATPERYRIFLMPQRSLSPDQYGRIPFCILMMREADISLFPRPLLKSLSKPKQYFILFASLFV